jgi:hypothetical protein
VASPRRDTIEEARYFATKLGEADIVVRVPFLPTDVHDLAGLAEVARHLL